MRLTDEEITAAKQVKLAHRAREQVLAALGDIVKNGPGAFGATQVYRMRSENFNRSRNEDPNATTVDRCKRCFSASHKYGPDCGVPEWSPPVAPRVPCDPVPFLFHSRSLRLRMQSVHLVRQVGTPRRGVRGALPAPDAALSELTVAWCFAVVV